MAVLERNNILSSALGSTNALRVAGAPSAGTTEVETLTIGGTPTAGTFKLGFDGYTTAAITWSATNATLLASINTALDALPNLGDGDLVATAGTLTAGIGTVTLTFSANEVKKLQPTLTVADNSLTGTSPTLAIAKTTPGVDATYRGSSIGGQLVDTTTGIVYSNTGTTSAPTWTKIGTQT